MDEERTPGQSPPVDGAGLRFVMSRFATGIAVVAGRDEERRPRAITVNAFSSLSLDPPLVLYCLDRSAFHFDVFSKAEAFAVSILAADQQALSERFAREAEDDFADLSAFELTTGCPVLAGCLAALDCETAARHEAGDHLIVIGRVTALHVRDAAEPLIYFRGDYRRLRT